MSAIDRPTFDGVSGVPVIETSPRLALHQQVVGLLRCVRTRRSVAAQAADDQPWMPDSKVFRAESETIGGSRREVLHEDIGAREQAREYVLRFGAFQIERQRFLRPVQPDEMARQPVHGGVVPAREVSVDRPLDLDDPRAEIGELPGGERYGDRLLHGDHRHPGEWRAGHRCAGTIAQQL